MYSSKRNNEFSESCILVANTFGRRVTLETSKNEQLWLFRVRRTLIITCSKSKAGVQKIVGANFFPASSNYPGYGEIYASRQIT